MQKKSKTSQLDTTISSKENVAINIDYEKLSKTIIDANVKSAELLKAQNEENEKALQEQRQDEWDKALWIKRYNGKNLILRFLCFYEI